MNVPNPYTAHDQWKDQNKQPAPFVPSVHDNWKDQNKQSNPAINNGSVVAAGDPSASVTRMGGGNQNVDLSRDNSWMAFMGQPEAPSNAPGAVNTPATNPNWPWGPDQSSGGQRSTSPSGSVSRGGAPTGSSFQSQQVIQPFEAMKAPTLPEYKGIGEYKPPEETDDAYNKARQGSMNAGVREMRDQAREAMSTSQSLDNPNARAKFVQQALKGYGQGLSKVAQQAGKEGRTEASRSRAEELQTYKTNYDIKSDAYLTNYQNEINQIATDFASGQAANVANYNANLNPNVTVAGQGGGATYGPNKTAPSKSMQKYGFEVLYS
jgi:hypothetical protein